MQGLWSAALPLLRQNVGDRNYTAWIEPIRCHSEGEEVCLEVPSRFFQAWVTRHFLPVIREAVTGLAGAPREVRVRVAAEQAAAIEARAAAVEPVRERTQKERAPKIGRLVPHYTFDTFVVGAANEMAFKAARAVTAAPGRRFNPVFLHGGVGLGKTHLINAIAHELLRGPGRLQVACLSAESFMNSLITSLRQDQMNGFRERFREIGALVLDDVQFLAGKERTQEEFFHTFNALHGSGRQIVLTSDKPPAAIAGLEQRLRSRFEGGLIVDIHPPTREMRLAILAAKAAAAGITLCPEAADVLVQRGGVSVRELEGALNRVAAMAAVQGTAITADLAAAALGPYRESRRRVSVEAIQEMVSSRFGVSIADLVSHRRERCVSYPRQVAMYLSRTVGDASFPSIAEKFGGRDHSSVMYAVKQVEGRRAAETAVDQLLLGIEGELRARVA